MAAVPLSAGMLNGLTCVVGAAVLSPLACMYLWRVFGKGFLSCLAPKEFHDSLGQGAVFAVWIGLAFEVAVVAGWCVAREVAVGDGGAGTAVLGVAGAVYAVVAFLFTASYHRASEATSDALFTIDRQRDEVICDRCSRLVHPHTQHCAYCWRCVDRFDHHSFFLNNCVAERNVKQYTLALVYGVARACLALCILTLHSFRPSTATHFVVFPAMVASATFGLATAFLLLVWSLAVTYGFNSNTDTGRNTEDGTSSLEVRCWLLRFLSFSFFRSFSSKNIYM